MRRWSLLIANALPERKTVQWPKENKCNGCELFRRRNHQNCLMEEMRWRQILESNLDKCWSCCDVRKNVNHHKKIGRRWRRRRQKTCVRNLRRHYIYYGSCTLGSRGEHGILNSVMMWPKCCRGSKCRLKFSNLENSVSRIYDFRLIFGRPGKQKKCRNQCENRQFSMISDERYYESESYG